METTEKRPQGYWLTKEGREEKAKLKEAEEQGQTKEPTITITVSELEALLDKKLNEKIKDIQPESEVKKPKDKYAIFEDKSSVNIDDIPELENFEVRDRYYSIMDDSIPSSYYIANRHTKNQKLQYYNKKTNTTSALRYSTNQKSILVENQSKEEGSVILGYIVMENGMLFVPKENPTLQKFLAIHPHLNLKFREINHAEEAKKELADIDLGFKAQKLVRDLDFAGIDAIARLVCLEYNENWDSATVKKEVFSKIASDPQKFINYAEDKTLALKGIAKTANSRGYISYNNYRFKDEKGVVFLEVSRNENEWEAIADYLISNEGNQLREYLEDKIK